VPAAIAVGHFCIKWHGIRPFPKKYSNVFFCINRKKRTFQQIAKL
jgi:hypothetical protein